MNPQDRHLQLFNRNGPGSRNNESSTICSFDYSQVQKRRTRNCVRICFANKNPKHSTLLTWPSSPSCSIDRSYTARALATSPFLTSNLAYFIQARTVGWHCTYLRGRTRCVQKLPVGMPMLHRQFKGHWAVCIIMRRAISIDESKPGRHAPAAWLQAEPAPTLKIAPQPTANAPTDEHPVGHLLQPVCSIPSDKTTFARLQDAWISSSLPPKRHMVDCQTGTLEKPADQQLVALSARWIHWRFTTDGLTARRSGAPARPRCSAAPS